MHTDLEKFFDLSLDMMCIAGEDFRFKRVNDAFERTLGWSRRELESRPYLEFVHPADLEATRKEAQKLAQGNPTIHFQNRYRCADGSYRYLAWTSQRDPDSGLFYALARDITWMRELERELTEAKEQAETADRLKTLFLASMSHEIRTPMTGVLGMSDLALERTDDLEVRHCLETIRDSSEALLGLINDILDFSKIEAGRLTLENEPFALRELLGSTVRNLTVTAQRKGLELSLRVAPHLPDALRGDAGRLRQVLNNLIGNAIKFTDRGSVAVEVDGSKQGDDRVELRFQVEDTGIGIAEELQPFVFERFWQVDPSRVSGRGGAGLGLAISAQLVSLMEGEIAVQGDRDQGSCFWFRLPLEVREDRSRDEELASRLSRRNLLVFDARERSREILLELLRERGAEPTVTVDRERTLEALATGDGSRGPYDLLLIDCNHGQVRDLDLVERIRSEVGPETDVVLIVDAAVRPGEMRRCRQLDISSFIRRPILEAELDLALRRAVGLDVGTARRIALPSQRLPPLRILLAEDSPVNQQVARGLLEARGHTVEVVEDGEKAVAAALGREYDLLLMDLRMPKMDGLEATRRIRAAESDLGRHLPIVAMTAQATRTDQARCHAAGIEGYLVKPIRADALFEAVRRTVVGNHDRQGRRPACELPESEMIDWARALEAAGGQRRLLDRMVEAAIGEIPAVFERLREALSRGDAEAVTRHAHTLKGTLRYFGASDLDALAESAERAGGSGRIEAARQAVDAMSEVLEAFVEELATFTSSETPRRDSTEEVGDGRRAGRR